MNYPYPAHQYSYMQPPLYQGNQVQYGHNPQRFESERKEKIISDNAKCIYIGDIHPNVDNDELITLIKKYDIRIKEILFFNKGYPNAYAYIELYSKEEVTKAIEKLNHHLMRGREIRVTEKKNPRDLPVEANLFLKCPSNVDIKLIDNLLNKLSLFRTTKAGQSKYLTKFLRNQEFNKILQVKELEVEGISGTINLRSIESYELEITFPEGIDVETYNIDQSIINIIDRDGDIENVIFSSYVRRNTKPNESNKLTGYFQLRDEKRAEMLNKREININGLTTEVKSFKSKKKDDNNVLFIKNIKMDKESLETILTKLLNSRNGEFHKIKVDPQRDSLSALLYFEDIDRLENFLEHDKKNLGSEIITNNALKKSVNNLYTCNLLQSVTEQKLKEVFKKYGKMLACRLILPEKFEIPSKTKHGYLSFSDPKCNDVILREARLDRNIQKLYDRGVVKISKLNFASSHKASQGNNMPKANFPFHGMQNNQFFESQPFYNSAYQNPMQYPQANSYVPIIRHNNQNKMMAPAPHNVYPNQRQNSNMGVHVHNMQQPVGGNNQPMMPHNNRGPYNQYGNQHPSYNQHQQQYHRDPNQYKRHNYQYSNQTPGNYNNHQGNSGNQHRSNIPDRSNQNRPQSQQIRANISWESIDVPSFIMYADEFDKLPDEQKFKILGGLIFRYLLSINFEDSKIPKITGMLIDPEVFTIQEIKDFFNDDCKELNSRAEEALELLNNPNSN